MTVVLTGNPYGIGVAAARLFAGEGAQVICLDDADSHWASALRIEGAHSLHVDDLSDPNSLDAVVSTLRIKWPQVNLLFNLSGHAIRERFEETSLATWQHMMDRNLKTALICTQGLLPLMKGGRGSSVINHGSIDGSLGNPALAAYSTAKGGMIPLTHVMAHDLAKYGVRVNCISTGGIRDAALRPGDEQLIDLTPLGRLGTPEDVARSALFLASDSASYINAANLVLDGGRSTITQGCFAT